MSRVRNPATPSEKAVRPSPSRSKKLTSTELAVVMTTGASARRGERAFVKLAKIQPVYQSKNGLQRGQYRLPEPGGAVSSERDREKGDWHGVLPSQSPFSLSLPV